MVSQMVFQQIIRFPLSGRARAFFPVLALFFAAAIPLRAEPVSTILSRADGLLGQPYVRGGTRPGGFDCSGLITYLYRPTLPDLPRMSRDMAGIGVPVNFGEWQPGDLLFYATGTDSTQINHVALWYGDGYVLHSISNGPETGVVITPARSGYWAKRYAGSRRVLPRDSTIFGIPPRTNLPEAEEIVKESPWNTFDGVLRGDFDAWQKADEDAFEKYKRENG
jgi:hypothetical protein